MYGKLRAPTNTFHAHSLQGNIQVPMLFSGNLNTNSNSSNLNMNKIIEHNYNSL
jgi:hypothetical protein